MGFYNLRAKEFITKQGREWFGQVTMTNGLIKDVK